MAKKIFEVEISNRGPRGYETAALLKMPATWGEFNDALQKARIEDGRCCQNELTRIEYPGIQREMIGDNVDLYELNLLAQRLSELSKDDQMGMDGLLQIEKIHSTGPISLPRLINLTFNADICLLAPQVSNTQELGALLYEGEMLSDEAMALLDTTEPDSQFQNALLGVFGQKHQEDFDGVFTSQGYVEPGDEFKEVYRRGEIAPYFDHSGAPVVLEVSKGYFDDPGYSLSVTLQGTFASGLTGFGTSIGTVGQQIIEDLNGVESVTEMTGTAGSFGLSVITSPIMIIFCIILMAYAVIKVFFSNLKRGGILLIQIAVGSLYMFSIPRGYTDGFIQWIKQVIGLCLTAFLQSTILVAGLMVFKDHALLGLGLMLSAGEVPRIAGTFGLDTTTRANIMSAVYTAQAAVNTTRTIVQAVASK